MTLPYLVHVTAVCTDRGIFFFTWKQILLLIISKLYKEKEVGVEVSSLVGLFMLAFFC
jgi:hypothetical protein